MEEKSYVIHNRGNVSDRIVSFTATEDDAATIFNALFDADECECYCITDDCDVTDDLLE